MPTDPAVAEALLRACYPLLPAELPFPIPELLVGWTAKMDSHDPAIRSERIGEYQVSYGTTATGFQSLLTPWERQLMARYAAPTLAMASIGGDSYATSPKPPLEIATAGAEPSAGYVELPDIARGTNWEWRALIRESGVIIPFTDVDAAVTQPTGPADLDPIIAGDGAVVITLTEPDTAALIAGRWHWDLYGTTTAAGRFRVLQGHVNVYGGLAEEL